MNGTSTRNSTRTARAVSSAGLLLLGCLAITAAARADVYDLNATIGTQYGFGVGVFPGPDTGLSVTGTVDLSGSGSASLTVGSDPLLFAGACTTSSCVVSSNGFIEFGILDFGSGSTLLPDSYIAANDPPGLVNGAEKQYYLTGTITPAGGSNGINPTVTPEPSFFGMLALCLGGVFATVLHRRRKLS
jgi:hypothetical protein